MLHVLLALSSTLFLHDAAAHELGVAVLELRDAAAGGHEVSLRVPGRPLTETPSLLFPERCLDAAAPLVTRDLEATRVLRRVRCEPALGATDSLVVRGLAGGVFVRAALAASGSAPLSFTRLEEAGGGEKRVDLRPPARSSDAAQRGDASFVRYLHLGMEHIVFGLDHVLFVLGLTLLARGRRLVWLVTGFTLGHSVTLALATLGLATLPAPPVEAAIALTLVFLAREILAAQASRAAGGEGAHLATRSHVLLCAVFGLLHGLGFAGALADVGLPHDALALALLSFNLGVEAGQLGVVACALALAWTWRRLAPQPAFSFTGFAARALGMTAVAWTLVRVATFWSSAT